jgi:hypothetical protein
MRDRRKLANQANLLVAQHLLRAAAAQDLAETQAQEIKLRTQEDGARLRVEQASDAWMACFNASNIDPRNLGDMAVVLTRQDSELRAASQSVERATARTQATHRKYAESDVRTRQSEDVLRRMRRRVSKEELESEMSALEDRITYRSVRP